MIQVYPNHTTNEVKVNISCEYDGESVLFIHNILGKMIRMIPVKEPGAHIVPFGGLPEGIYFIRLDVNGITQTEKVFIKSTSI